MIEYKLEEIIMFANLLYPGTKSSKIFILSLIFSLPSCNNSNKKHGVEKSIKNVNNNNNNEIVNIYSFNETMAISGLY